MYNSRRYLCAAALTAGFFSTLSAYGAADPEAKQMTEDFSPQAQSRLAIREAQAAYQDAVNGCKTMKSAERNNCMKEARSNLQADLANAKKMRSSGQ
jgi:vacuolar-type H+-ATPase subunit H